MLIINGMYTSKNIKEDHSFCLWAESSGQNERLPAEATERLEEFAMVDEEIRYWIPRVKMAECMLALSACRCEFSSEISFWLKLFKWVKEQAEKRKFYPGLIQIENHAYFAKWILERSDLRVQEDLEEWVRAGLYALEDREDVPSWVLAFIGDSLDSYIRFCINTRISLNNSQLGKLLKFKPFYLHEEWFHRLCMEEYIEGSGKRWDELFADYQRWVGIEHGEISKGRLCFRLETSQNERDWKVRFFWLDQTGRLRDWQQIDREDLSQHFLRSLVHASEVWPLIKEQWETAPSYCPVTLEEAYQFLKQEGPALRAMGFSVMAPKSMLRKERNAIGLRIKLEPWDKSGSQEEGWDRLIHFDYSVALGNQEISPIEWERMVASEPHFYQLNGEWIEVNQEEFGRAAQWITKQKKKKDFTFRDAWLLQAMDGDPEFLPLSVDAVETKGWLADLMSLMNEGTHVTPLSPPKLFKGELRPYQTIGMTWLIHLRNWRIGACLADDMGLGKTIQFLSYLAYCKEMGWLEHPFLLICPTSVLGNWQREIQKFVPDLSVWVHHGPERMAGDQFIREAGNYDLVLTTYSIIQRDHSFLTFLEWDGVALDEAQHIKNASSLQSKAVRRLKSKHRIALTGTPMENRIEELWSILEFLNQGFLGSSASFRRQFVGPIEKSGDKTRLQTLKKLVKPFILRRSKTDPQIINDLPEKMESKEYCYLTAEQAVLYKRIVDELLAREKKALGFERKGLILAAISKLKQICNHPSLYYRETLMDGRKSGKLARLSDMLEEMSAEGDRMLIFTQFAQMGHLLQRYLQDYLQREVPFLYGGVDKGKRDGMIAQFQQDDGPPVFLLSLKAGGIGLNLTQANRVIHFDRWWNPAVENQATDRAYRIGQTRTVHVHKLICMGTIEEKIDLMIERKKELVHDIMGAGEAWITDLSSAELQELLTLRNELVEES